ncbi:MAG: hypothetical protein FJX92_02185 [Bacteroidetes bacterium]|nr:hypothetical protein [Bacteroidota bacterium]
MIRSAYVLFILFALHKSAKAELDYRVDTVGCDSLLSFKYTDNRGRGEAEWNGIRNIRAVLPGILYRSGGNGSYNNLLPRPNDSPMTFQGLLNLYERGFDKVYYLYASRFSTQYPEPLLDLLDQVGIEYRSIVPTNDSIARLLLRSIYQTIESPEAGPILIHCWNGWHMSGLVSAYALMQFCAFSGPQAWEYWRKNTDGNDNGFGKLKSRILNFTPDPALQLSERQKTEYCPCKQ